jgi:hypothetical protein
MWSSNLPDGKEEHEFREDVEESISTGTGKKCSKTVWSSNLPDGKEEHESREDVEGGQGEGTGQVRPKTIPITISARGADHKLINAVGSYQQSRLEIIFNTSISSYIRFQLEAAQIKTGAPIV